MNIGRLQPLRLQIEDVLYRLSQDAWTIDFVQMSGAVEPKRRKDKAAGKTLLFSGGADSLAAALEFAGEPLQLISDKTHNMATDASQKRLAAFLSENGYSLPHVQVFVSSRDGGPTDLKHAEEESQRTRSFVFLTIGALAARQKGMREIVYLAENGQMAVHLPLTQGRIGALSTHTAHPEVLASMQQLLSDALGVEMKITNPYLYQTKGEVVARILRHLKGSLWLSNSCWRSARLKQGTHCGECIPCFVRRIAIEHHCTDETIYARNPWIEELAESSPDDIARRNMVDLGEFVLRFVTMMDDDIIAEWPELISDVMDGTQVISMYRRFAAEATTVLARYPHMKAFLS